MHVNSLHSDADVYPRTQGVGSDGMRQMEEQYCAGGLCENFTISSIMSTCDWHANTTRLLDGGTNSCRCMQANLSDRTYIQRKSKHNVAGAVGSHSVAWGAGRELQALDINVVQHPVDVATPYHAFSYTNTSICWGSRLPYRENIITMNWLTPHDPMERLAPRHHPHHNNHRFLSSLGPTTRRYTVEKQLRKILYTGVHLGVCTRPVQTRMAIRTKKTCMAVGSCTPVPL